MYQARISEAAREMDKVVQSFAADLRQLRTGRATPALVEDVIISLYGTPTPLKHAATITAPDPHLIVISPWDKSLLTEIENALRLSDLGVNPANDGTVVRVAIPPMTEERRKDLVKKLKTMAEEVKVALRTIRREAWDEIQDMEREGTISEDDRYAAEKELNTLIDRHNRTVDDLAAGKEKEILSI